MQEGLPLSIGVIIAGAVLGTLIVGGLVVMAVLSAAAPAAA
ncbi:MAG: hypothetical protein Q7R50_02585 [Dehalococcoidales bacterium]|nr:hypothetical protein [Dehalococcoidales bacterium]